MEELNKAEEYICSIIHNNCDHAFRCEQYCDRAGVSFHNQRANDWRSVLSAVKKGDSVSGAIIVKAVEMNLKSTSSLGPCWERYLLDAYNELKGYPPNFDKWLSDNYHHVSKSYYTKISSDTTYSIEEIRRQYVMDFAANPKPPGFKWP